jgi:hypothetical protein
LDQSSDPEDRARDEALVDNTAQGISKNLDEIENKREVYERRWTWELLQNALDTAPVSGSIDIKIALEGSRLTFEHNGRPFEADEVAHLVGFQHTIRRPDP